MDNRLAEFQRLLSATAQPVDLLLQQMPPAQARVLRLCAIPHEFDEKILRALAPELSAEEAREFSDAFARLSLIATREDSLAMHDGPRRYLFEQWLAEDRRAEFMRANNCLIEFFSPSKTACENSEPFERAQRSRMFHLIGASRVAGFAEFERLCRKARAQLRLGECETLLKFAHEYDRVLNPLEVATLAYHEGKLAADRQNWESAGHYFAQVLATPEISAELRAKTFCRLGIIHHAQRDWKNAIRYFQEGLAFSEPRPECAKQFVHLELNLGSTYRESGELAKAETLLQKGIADAKKNRELSSIADGCNSLGALYLKLADTPRAIAAFEESLQALDEIGDTFRHAQVFNNLGNAYADARAWEKSREFYRRSLEIKRQAGDNSGQAMTLTNLVRVYRAQHKTENAVAAAQDAARLFAEVRDFFNVAVAKRNLARIARSSGEVEKARNLFLEAAAIFERAGDKNEAENAREEAQDLGINRGLPWWVYLAIVLFLALLALIAVAIFYNRAPAKNQAGISLRALGKCAVQYSSPFFETRNSSDGSLNSVAPQVAHLCSGSSSLRA